MVGWCFIMKKFKKWLKDSWVWLVGIALLAGAFLAGKYTKSGDIVKVKLKKFKLLSLRKHPDDKNIKEIEDPLSDEEIDDFIDKLDKS